MKIAMSNVFLPTDEKAGVAFQVHYLANSLVRRGHDVTIFSFSPRPSDALYDVHQFVAPRLPGADWLRKFYPFIFAWHLARTDYSAFDVIHVHGDNFLLWHVHPQVRTFHGSAYDEARAAKTTTRKVFFYAVDILERIGARLADHNVGVSSVTKARLQAVETIIPCGVDLEAFRPGEKSQHPTILFVGTNEGRKRGRFLAETFVRDVVPYVPGAELLMVCDADLGLESVRYLGRVPLESLTRLFAEAWVFCMPSTYEGFGVPYIEAMAAGTPVVATDNASAHDILADGAYGRLTDDATLGDALRELLMDRGLRDSLGARGRERSRAFDWDTVAAQYESVYTESVRRRATLRPVAGRRP